MLNNLEEMIHEIKKYLELNQSKVIIGQNLRKEAKLVLGKLASLNVYN